MRALFDLEPRPLDSDYEPAFRRAEGSKRALVVVFCDLLEEAAARPLVEAVPGAHAAATRWSWRARPTRRWWRSRRRAEGDPLAAGPGRDRRRRPRRPRAGRRAGPGRGARVLEAPPDRLPATVVAAYLRAKSRAVL